MKISPLKIEGVYLIDNYEYYDERGGFVKTFSRELFHSNNISFEPAEIYYSISKKDVIRGMHFQVPPKEHAKLIYVVSGEIIDVILDLRKSSPTYGCHISVPLIAKKNSIYIPVGCAHGFKSLEENTIVVYNQTSCYSKKHDAGILWNSFGFDWGCNDPIVSERDKDFQRIDELISPF